MGMYVCFARKNYVWVRNLKTFEDGSFSKKKKQMYGMLKKEFGLLKNGF